MVQIFGNWGRIRTWINKLIRIKDTGNLFVGEDSGKVTTGDYNNFVGYHAGYSNTSGIRNNFMGYQAGYSNTTGYYNTFVGFAVGYSNTSGHSNNFMGYKVGYANTTGYSNNFMGHQAGHLNTVGHSNIFIGHQAGHSNVGGVHNTIVGFRSGYTNSAGGYSVFIGSEAGYYETGGVKLFIDNQKRIDEADGRIKALIYGIFDAATANQRLSINAQLLVREVTTYANDAAAGTGGLVTGEIYKHADGSLHIKL